MRGKKDRHCNAQVRQYDDRFEFGDKPHRHPANPAEMSEVKVRKEVSSYLNVLYYITILILSYSYQH